MKSMVAQCFPEPGIFVDNNIRREDLCSSGEWDRFGLPFGNEWNEGGAEKRENLTKRPG